MGETNRETTNERTNNGPNTPGRNIKRANKNPGEQQKRAINKSGEQETGEPKTFPALGGAGDGAVNEHKHGLT